MKNKKKAPPRANANLTAIANIEPTIDLVEALAGIRAELPEPASLTDEQVGQLHLDAQGDLDTMIALGRSYLLRAYKAGYVIEARKAAMKHGEYLPWLDVVEIPRRTASRYKLVRERLDALAAQMGQSWPISLLGVSADKLEAALKAALPPAENGGDAGEAAGVGHDDDDDERANGSHGVAPSGSEGSEDRDPEAGGVDAENAIEDPKASTSTEMPASAGDDGRNIADEQAAEHREVDDVNDPGSADSEVGGRDEDDRDDEPPTTDKVDADAGQTATTEVRAEWVRSVQHLHDALDFTIPGPGLHETFAGFGRDDFNALVAVLDTVRERLVDVGEELDRVAEAVDEVVTKARARRKAKPVAAVDDTVDA